MNRSLIRPIGFLLCFAGVIFIVYATGWYRFLQPELVRTAVLSTGNAAPLVFMFTYALSTVLFLPATPLTLLGGALFGPVWGSVFVIVGATVGAVGAFLLARYAGGSLSQRVKGGVGERLRAYEAKLQKRAFLTIVFLRLLPIVPFNGLNIALGLTTVPWLPYALATFVGIMPGTIAYVYFGNALSMLSLMQIIIGALVIIGLSWGSQRLARRYQVL